MNLYTASYGGFRHREGLAAVRISLGHPRWHLSYHVAGVVKELAPRGEMLEWEREAYEPAYRAILDGLGVDHIRELLEAASGGAGAVAVLCFENLAKPGAWCHRRIFAEWWEEQTGEAVPELGDAKTGGVWPGEFYQTGLAI